MRTGQFVVAIDGPAASGKSTVSRRVAEALGCYCVDSGALYRGLTWWALRNGLDVRDPEAMSAMTAAMEVEAFIDGPSIRFRLNGFDPGQEIRGAQVTDNVSHVARVPGVRERVVAWLRGTVDLGRIVMEGRDIGSVVFPTTPHKFYLDASPDERARRRQAELVNTPHAGPSVADVGESIRRRDAIDSTRKTAPLKIAEGARVIDSSSVSIDGVVGIILQDIEG